MSNKMERFTGRARWILSLAQSAAEESKHSYIGTEHMLLALVREEGGVAGRVLRDLGVGVTQLENLVIELSEAEIDSVTGAIDLAPDTKRVLERTVDEARRMGHHYIGTEHLLLGLVRVEACTAVAFLKRLNISLEEIRRQTRRVLQESPLDPANYSPPSTEKTTKQPAEAPIWTASLPAEPESDVFRVLKSALDEILRMVETGSLTLKQAKQLFQALHPENLTIVESHRLLVATARFELIKDRWLRLIITDKSTDGVQFDMKISMSKFFAIFDHLVQIVMDQQTGAVIRDNSDPKNRMEIRIEEDK